MSEILHLQQMASKQRYRLLCETEPSIPFFSQAWWLDTLAGEDGWGVAIVDRGGRIVASMPYVIRKRFGQIILSQPPLTQSLGPWMCEVHGKHASRLSSQQGLMRQLIEALPRYDHFIGNWHCSQTNWLPFYWAGFEQTTCYTYRLPDLSNVEGIWNGFRDNIKWEIRKAEGRFGLRVRVDLGLDAFLRLNIATFKRQGKYQPYSNELVRRLDDACTARQVRRIFIAEDAQGHVHAGVYLVWDKNSAYYLMGGGDPEKRKSGATSLCLWEAIKFASTVTRSFDFEGSMIEPVERFFRAFGAEQTTYFSVSRTPSKLIRAMKCLRAVSR